MTIDRQGKNIGESAVEKITQRGNENKPSQVTQLINRTKDKVEKVLKK